MQKLSIVNDGFGNNVVAIPEIIFRNKQQIQWKEVEKFLRRFVGEIIEIWWLIVIREEKNICMI